MRVIDRFFPGKVYEPIFHPIVMGEEVSNSKNH